MFVPVFPWLWFSHETSEEIEAREKIRAKEANRKYFKKMHKLIPERLKELGFNVMSFDCILGEGGSYFITSKKYPNLWTTFSYNEEYVTPQITWQFYIHENRWSNFVMSPIQFINMINPEGYSIFTIENFDKMAKLVAWEASESKYEEGKLCMYNKDGFPAYFNFDMNFFKNMRPLTTTFLYYYLRGMEMKKFEHTCDNIQWKLINNFIYG